MRMKFLGRIAGLGLGAMTACTIPALAESDTAKADHTHAHEHADASAEAIHKGYFEDSQIQPRQLDDWSGDWQSIYPYLTDGTLDPVMVHKAENGDKTAEEYRAYYGIGYKTDVDRIEIADGRVTFHRGDQSISGEYVNDGYEVLTYKKGNRGVRYSFRKTDGDAAAPGYIQFSDHHIAPEKVGHYHLYWGDDRDTVLAELTNWPTYFPAALSGDEVVKEMMAH